MDSKLTGFLVETLYATFVLFFYVYMVMSLVKFQPFSIGLYPVTDMDVISPALLTVFAVVSFLKAIAYMIRLAQTQPERRKKLDYIPTQRS